MPSRPIDEKLAKRNETIGAAHSEQACDAAKLTSDVGHLRAIFDASPNPIAVVDLQDDKIALWSRRALELFGHTAPTAAEWYEIAYPDPDYRRDVVERWKPYLEAARRSGRAVNTGEYRVTCKDGSERICELYAAFLPDYLIVTFNDITERKSAERELGERESFLRRIIHQSPFAMWISDAGGTLKQANPALKRFLNLSDEQLVGKYNVLNDPVVERQGLLPLIRTVYEESKTINFTCEWNGTDFPGLDLRGAKSVNIEATMFPVLDQDGVLTHVVLSWIDITARRQAENEILALQNDLELRVRQRTLQLEETSKELEDFVYSVSHDLRAPLRSISGFAEIIDRRHRASLNEESSHYFDNIIKASRQMGVLIDDLLTFSRLGRKAITIEPVALDDVFAAVLETLSGSIKETKAQVNLSPMLPIVQGDQTLITTLFVNLLENAIKYKKADLAPRIDVHCDVDEEDVVVSIVDNGIGIHPDYHEKIFSIFQRLHSHDDYPGTGIGLAAAKKSAQLLGGAIWVESQPDIGSTFRIRFPKTVTPAI